MTKPSKLDEIFDRLEGEFEEPPTLTRADAKSEIKALIEEVIGRDELETLNNTLGGALVRNELRAAQRQRKDAL